MTDQPAASSETKAQTSPEAFFERISPVTGKPVSRGRAMTVTDACAIADRAQAALAPWSGIGPSARRELLLGAADRLVQKGEAFAQMMIAETGCTEGWARMNVMHGASLLREAASLTTQVKGEIIPSDRPKRLSMAVREPAGVVLGIAPWNAPIVLGLRALATPLACGNTVIFKASELCPGTHDMLAGIFADAGFAQGVVNLVSNAPEDAGDVVGALIDHPAVRRINFTGSTNVGRIIARRAAEQLKPVLLELGGKAPLLVLDDADLSAAAQAAAFGAFMNQGQICMSTERIIVDEKVADRFVELLVEKTKGFIAQDPSEKSALLGAVIDRDVAPRLNSLVENAISNGAELVAGQTCEGTIVQPLIIDHVDHTMRLYHEESFAPVVAICRARDDDHAIKLANDTEYGLAAAVFTQNGARGLKVAQQVKAGACHINSPTAQDEPQVPFGGMRNSGYGRFGGLAGINEFTELRWVTLDLA